jgi:serine/threonine-protein kinase
MGIVYCARHVHLDRRVALKLLSPEVADSDDFRKRFIRESRIAASINHPNIVTVYDAGERDGQLYIAMQFIDGSDLHTLLRAQRVLPSERVLWIVGQIASALDAAHARGLVHRDVKPGNILLDDEHAYLTDFGLTKSVALAKDGEGTTTVTAAGHFLGTVNYVATEQILSGDVDARTDVYALGSVIYECLAGGVPFARGKEMETLAAKLRDPLPELTAKRPDLPPAIDQVLARAMAREKQDRHASCGELFEATAEALGVAPATEAAAVPARPTSSMPHEPEADTSPDGPVKAPRRIPAWAPVAVLGGIAAAVAAVLLASGGTPTPVKPVAHKKPAPIVTAKSDVSVSRPVSVGPRPFGIAVASGGVWVTVFDQDGLHRLDPVTGQVTGERISVGDGPFAVAAAQGYVWVADMHADAVTRVDPATGTPSGAVKVCNGPVGERAAAGSLWVVCQNDDTLARVDPKSRILLGRTHVGDLPRGIAATKGTIWVTSRRQGTVLRVDTATGKVRGKPIRVGRDPTWLTVGNRVVWVTNNDDDTVTRISAKTGRVVGKPILVGHAPWGIAYGLGSVWVANSASNTVTRLNPQTGRVVGRPIPVGRQPSGLAVGAGSVWVTDNNEGTVTRITPKPAHT